MHRTKSVIEWVKRKASNFRSSKNRFHDSSLTRNELLRKKEWEEEVRFNRIHDTNRRIYRGYSTQLPPNDEVVLLCEKCAQDPEYLCNDCASKVCEFGEPLHFHHDGCPACESMGKEYY